MQVFITVAPVLFVVVNVYTFNLKNDFLPESSAFLKYR